MLTGSIGLGISFAITDRHGGVSAGPYASANLGGHVGDDAARVAENRCRLAAALGLDDRVVYMNQAHGREVVVVDGVPPDAPTCDGLVTTTPGLAVAVLVADCVPVLLADSVAGVVAAAHAGREGTRLDVVSAVVDVMVGLGAEPRRIAAVLGPAICGGCYEVPEAMRAEVTAVVPEAWATTRRGTPGLDVRRGVAGRLAELGVEPVRLGPCTYESPDHYSYRRDRVTGRFGALIWRHADAGRPT